jgi:hypothetical protein
MKKNLIFVFVALLTGVAVLGAQEPVEGLAFSGSVITGLRYRSYGTGEGYNVFDIEATDDYLVEGDTATLRAALNRGSYGATFALSLTANNTQASFWTIDRIYASEVSLWAKLLKDKFQAKAGYFYDFDYFTPVNAWNLAGLWSTNAVQLTAYPIEGLQIDVRAKTSDNNYAAGEGWTAANWFNGEEIARNIDLGIKYVNPKFTTFVALDDSSTASSEPVGSPGDSDYRDGKASTQADLYGYFAWTGIPKLTLSVETKFQDLTSELKKSDGSGDKIGVTNMTGFNVGYQITDAFYARTFIILGGAGKPGSFMATKPLLGEDDGFSFAVNAELSYKLNDTLTFFFTPIYQIPDTEHTDRFDIFVKPKVAWTLGSFPYAATINFWYMLGYYSDNSATWSYWGNNDDNLFHTVALTFNWSF